MTKKYDKKDCEVCKWKLKLLTIWLQTIPIPHFPQDKVACPLITIISAGAPVNTVNVVDGETVPVRYPWGTDQETSFDVVTLNRATRTIYCTRVGAGEDREISY